MINEIKSKFTLKRTILTAVGLVGIMVFWSIVGSILNIYSTNKIVGKYMSQTSLITSQFLTTSTPYTLEDIKNPICDQPTSMNFVAHQDDDILFMNPDLLHDIQAGNCNRTVYLTAGDYGRGREYWLSRQKGAQQAYGNMLGKIRGLWEEQIVKLPGGQPVTIASPIGNPRVSLIFLHLPDGNLRGNGFPSSGNQSLQKLYSGQISTVRTIGGMATYTSGQVVQALIDLMRTYKPSVIRSLSSSAGIRFQDHSDHANVARFVTKAYQSYIRQAKTASISYYLGYTVRERPENITGPDAGAKTRAFLAYGIFDGATCRKITPCYTQAAYGAYLKRQYTNPY